MNRPALLSFPAPSPPRRSPPAAPGVSAFVLEGSPIWCIVMSAPPRKTLTLPCGSLAPWRRAHKGCGDRGCIIPDAGGYPLGVRGASQTETLCSRSGEATAKRVRTKEATGEPKTEEVTPWLSKDVKGAPGSNDAPFSRGLRGAAGTPVEDGRAVAAGVGRASRRDGAHRAEVAQGRGAQGVQPGIPQIKPTFLEIAPSGIP